MTVLLWRELIFVSVRSSVSGTALAARSPLESVGDLCSSWPLSLWGMAGHLYFFLFVFCFYLSIYFLPCALVGIFLHDWK